MSGNTIEQFFTTLRNEVKLFKEIMEKYEVIIIKYNVPNANVIECQKLINDAIKEMENDMPKLRRDYLKCVIFGRISTGKSALINSLLLKNAVPSYYGQTTNSFIEIKKSLDGTNYVVFEDNPKKQHISSLEQIDDLLNHGNAKGSKVKLFYSAEECSLLKDNVVIVDTPGIDINEDMNESLIKECEDADVLLLLLDSASGLTESEKELISKYSTQFSKLKMLIIFNKWDQISEEDEEREKKLKTKYTKESKDYLCKTLKYKDGDAEKNIYFISAKEKLQIHQRNEGRLNKGWKKRENEFNLFSKKLKITLQNNNKKKKVLIMKKNRDIIQNTYNKIKEIILSPIKLSEEFRNCLNKLENNNYRFNNKVNAIVQSVFNKVKIKEDGNDVMNILGNIVKEIIDELKKEIRNLVSEEEDDVIKIINNLYLPFIIQILSENSKQDGVSPACSDQQNGVSNLFKLFITFFEKSSIKGVSPAFPDQQNEVSDLLKSFTSFIQSNFGGLSGLPNATSEYEFIQPNLKITKEIGPNSILLNNTTLKESSMKLFNIASDAVKVIIANPYYSIGAAVILIVGVYGMYYAYNKYKDNQKKKEVQKCLTEIKRELINSYERFLQQLPTISEAIMNNIQININSYKKRLSKLDEIIEAVERT